MKILGKTSLYVCSACGSRNIVRDLESGELVCGDCGLVIADHVVSTRPEWKAFTLEEHQERDRVGLPPSFSIYDKGLSTTIGGVSRDARGKRIPNKRRFEILRLRKWQARSTVNNSERNLAQAMSELDRLSDRLHLPSTVQEMAAVTYRKALKEGLVRGRNISSIAAASLYVACRMTRTPRTLRELAGMSPMDKGDISRCYRILLKDLGLHMPVPRAQRRVPKIASRAELGEETQRTAIEILGEADRLKITVGKAPMGMAAAALYLACTMNGENRTQKTLAEASGVTEVTLRNRYKDLKIHLDLDRFKPV
jgi:transcription initiation factor TFIIB